MTSPWITPDCPRCGTTKPERLVEHLWRCRACGVEFSTPGPGGWVEDGDLVWFASPTSLRKSGAG